MCLAVLVSSSQDRPNLAPVVERLTRAGVRVLVFAADLVADGRESFAWELCGQRARFRLQGEWHDLTSIAAAWWRKPQWVGLQRSDVALRMSIEGELLRTVGDIWALVPDKAWLNAPTRMRDGGARSLQLMLASQLGFDTPRSLVTNSWSDARDLGCNDVAFKVLGGGLSEQDRTRVLYTQKLSVAELGALSSRPYPGIIQEFIQKRREWRVTVVDDDVFCAAVYTDARGSVDWREHQLDGGVRFAAEDLPLEIQERCVAVVRGLQLGYSAIDLIEAPDGRFVFLEANPNGQYGWLEELLGLRISDAIARALCSRVTLATSP